MKRIFAASFLIVVILVATAFLVEVCSAAPSITSVTTADSVAIIVGSSFGNNWAMDFTSLLGPTGAIEDNTDGTAISSWTGATGWQSGQGNAASWEPTISTAQSYSGTQSILCDINRVTTGNWQSNLAYNHTAAFTKIFMSYYLYWDAIQFTPESRGTQWKLFKINDQNCIVDQAGEYTSTIWLDQNGSPFNYQFQFLCALECDAQSSSEFWKICSEDVAPDPWYEATFGDKTRYGFLGEGNDLTQAQVFPVETSWTRLEIYITRGAADDSTSTIEYYIHRPGEERFFIDKQGGWIGRVSEASCGVSCATCQGETGCRGPSDPWEWIHFQNFFDDSPPTCYAQGCQDNLPNPTSNCTPNCEDLWHDFQSEQAKFYFDDMFIQFGMQNRVYIGNDATFADCTYLELQEPTYWAADGDSIKVTLNYGPNISPDNAYIFVVDDNGDASSGTEVISTCASTCTGESVQWLQASAILAQTYNDLPFGCTATSSGSGPYTYEVTFSDSTATRFTKITRVSDDSETAYDCGSGLVFLVDWLDSFKSADFRCVIPDGGPTDTFGFHTWCGLLTDGDRVTVEQWQSTEWTSPWAHRMLLTVDPSLITSGARLENFPVLVELTSSHSAIFTQAKSDGSDIRFYDPDGSTVYSHELVSYDATAETAEFWVKKPFLSVDENTLWIYYENGAATSTSTSAVWSDYEAVYHYTDNPSAKTLTDSSPTGANASAVDRKRTEVPEGGTSNWTSSDLVSAKIGNGWTYEPQQAVHTQDISIDAVTWSAGAWLYHTNHGTDFFMQWDPFFTHLASQASDQSWDMQHNGSWCNSPADTSELVDYRWRRGQLRLNEWHHYMWVYDGSVPSITFYYDGVSQTATIINPSHTVCSDLRINPDGTTWVGIASAMFEAGLNQADLDGMDGIVDEFQIRASALPTAWVTTYYNMTNDPSSFISYSVEKTP